jgi:hypothetical protein
MVGLLPLRIADDVPMWVALISERLLRPETLHSDPSDTVTVPIRERLTTGELAATKRDVVLQI